MVRLRSVLALVLALVTTLLVSCSSPEGFVEPPSYSDSQLEQIQRYTADLQEMRDRLLEIPPLVQRGDWDDVSSFIHGPLGELRFKMLNVTRLLAPQAQQDAQEVSRAVFGRLVNIDEAAQSEDRNKALKNYNELLKGFDRFFQYVPGHSA